MPDNTKVNPNIYELHQPASLQTNRCFYLISKDKKFSSVKFFINR